ncbi:thiamine pyrophosphate-dependent dehydrogenase E1 component subunit alpha [Nonomuraea cavernae]|uniref:thiamine pyrophosphate-dependent dehydrogenase E1 component subunit alpha n=1 Tax=Nonomuraea cavernae TaxID=2045107 RepID=UPI0033C52235
MTTEQLVDAYTWMTLSRVVDERAFTLQRQGRLGTFSPTKGQEASVVGSAMALTVGQDWIVPQYRELGACLVHGLPLDLWFMYWMGNMSGGRIPDDVRILPVQISLAAQLPHAVGLAWARRLQNLDDVVIAYFGDGASSEGDFHEALNFAGVLRVPVIFFLQNNGWAISTPRSAQTAATSFACRAQGYGVAGATVDGNDVVAVYEVTKEAVARARADEGSTLIESITYRLGPHNTADDHTRYVAEGEMETMAEFDPIVRLRTHLISQGLWDEHRDTELLAGHARRAQQAAVTAEARRPHYSQVFDHVFARPTPRLARQAAEAERRHGQEPS